jgi:N utilization substance protein B
MDIVIMQIAIAEFMTFPNIPVSVTINEYVNLAKLYSTRNSGGYINGMLDSIARHLIDTGRLAKFMEPKPEMKSGPTLKRKAPRKRIVKGSEDKEE